MPLRRRRFNQSLLLAAAAGALPHSDRSLATDSTQGGRRIPWQNWSGSQRAFPAERAAPKTEEELAALLKNAVAPVRPVGSGHSFSGVAATDGTLVSTRHFAGVEVAGERLALVGAGAKLSQLGKPLHDLGQALPNLPDIDEQTVAGALATGTHGTGAAFGAMHDYVDALRLVTPRGEVLDCSRKQHPEIFDAARVSLGSLGVITRFTLRNTAPYKLKRRTWMEPLDEALERFHALAAAHRNFEMYFVPHSDNALLITTDETDEPIKPRGEDTDNDAVRQLKTVRDYASWWPWMRRRMITAFGAQMEPEESVDWWWNIYPSSRAVRFNEMEYHLPREAIVDVLRKVRTQVEEHHPDVFFPIEVRVVREDDAWLSPFYRRPTASLAVHRFFEEDYKPYFAAIEPLYQRHDGRPHWGKLHTLTGRELAARYPRWQDFQNVRRELDPDGRMLNPHLKTLFDHA